MTSIQTRKVSYVEARNLLNDSGFDCFQTAHMAQREVVGTWLKDMNGDAYEYEMPMDHATIRDLTLWEVSASPAPHRLINQ